MGDVDRSFATELVLRRMADSAFRDRLSATSDAGDRPIVVALADDTMIEVLRHVEQLGGAGNVVVPWLNGVVVVAMTGMRVADARAASDDLLDAGCTVGVFLERVRSEGPRTYEFVVRHDHHVDSGTAELVAIAG